MRTQAVILKKIPIKEYDELVICYTKDAGKQIYQAKSVLRSSSKQAGHLNILNLADFSLVQKNGLPIITSAYCLSAFPSLKSSLSAMAASYFILECFDKLIFEGEPDAELWNFLLEKLHNFDSYASDADYPWVRAITDARRGLLEILGYDPDYPIEYLADAQFKSLQFARKVLR